MKVFKCIKSNKILNNFIVLFTGDSISALFNIVSTAIIIQAIGLKANGMLLMIQTYALFFDQLFNFKIFESLIKYLTKSINDKNKEKSKSYIKQGFVLDLMTASVATIFGLIFIDFAISIMRWENQLKPFLILYMVTVIFNISGVCIGIIRTYNKFNYISYINIVISITKTVLYMVGLITKCDFLYYFIIEMILSIAKNIMLIYCACKIIYKNNMNDFYKAPLKFDRNFLVFSINTNLASSIDLPINTLTTFIMNKYLGFEAISVYKALEKIGGIIGKFSSPLNQIVYPELNLYVAKKEEKKAIKLSVKLSFYIFLIGIFILSFIMITYQYWLGVLIPNYQPYIGSLFLYVIYIIFTNATATTHSLFLALGYVKYVIPILLIVNTIYILIVFPSVIYYGLNGILLTLIVQAFAVVFLKLVVMKNKNIVYH